MLNFNGKAIPNFVRVSKINMQVLPAVNFDTIQMGQGTITGKTKLGSKLIKVSISIVPTGIYDTMAKCRRALASWLAGNNFGLSELIITDDADVKYMAKVSTAVDIDDLWVAGTGEIDFIVPSGLGYIDTWIKDIPMGTVTYVGTSPAPVKFIGTATHDIDTSVVLANATTGTKYTIILNEKAGAVVTVDTGMDVVKINDKPVLSAIGLNSETIELVAGDNELTCDNIFITFTASAPVNYL